MWISNGTKTGQRPSARSVKMWNRFRKRLLNGSGFCSKGRLNKMLLSFLDHLRRKTNK